MLNYMRAEFYKVLHRKYLYVTTIVLMVCAGLLVAGWVFTNANGNGINFAFAAQTAVPLLAIGLYLTILVGDIVFSDQYKFNTLKNEVSFGLSRPRIYLGKLAVECIVGTVMSLLVLGFYVFLCWLTLYPSGPEATELALTMVGFCLLSALPQWLAIMALTNLIYFLVRGNTIASFAVIGVVVVPPTVLELLLLFSGTGEMFREVCITLNTWMPGNMVGNAVDHVGDWSYVGLSWVLGLVWMVVCGAIGLTVFRRKEIN